MSEPVRSATRKEVLDSLRAIPLFCAVSESDLESIASHLIERRHPKNALIVEEGLPGDYMYVVREGRVKVIKGSEDGREKIMDFLEVGDFFGEMSLLDRAPRSASVKTMEPVLLLALSRTAFLDLLSRSPSLSLAVIQVLTGIARPWQTPRQTKGVPEVQLLPSMWRRGRCSGSAGGPGYLGYWRTVPGGERQFLKRLHAWSNAPRR